MWSFELPFKRQQETIYYFFILYLPNFPLPYSKGDTNHFTAIHIAVDGEVLHRGDI